MRTGVSVKWFGGETRKDRRPPFVRAGLGLAGICKGARFFIPVLFAFALVLAAKAQAFGKGDSPAPVHGMSDLSFLHSHEFFLLMLILGLFAAAWAWLRIQRLRVNLQKRALELEQAERKLQAMFEGSPLSVGLVEEGSLAWHNRAMTGLTGYEPREIKGQTPEFLFEDAAIFGQWMQDSSLGGDESRLESVKSVLKGKNGRNIECHLKYTPLGFSDKGPSGLFFVEKITEAVKTRLALRESEHKYRSIFEKASDAIFILNDEGRILEVNSKFCRMLGYEKDEVIGKTITEIDTPEYAAVAHQRLEQIRREESGIFESAHLAKSGRVVPLEISTNYITHQGEMAFISLARDIAERKQTEGLTRLQRDLGMELGLVKDVKSALELGLDKIMGLDEVDCAALYIVDPGDGSLVLEGQRKISKEYLELSSRIVPDSPQGKLVGGGVPAFMSYREFMCRAGITERQKEIWTRDGLLCFGVVPIKHKGQVIANIYSAGKKAESYSDFTRHALEAIAHQISGAMLRIESDQALAKSQRNLRTLFKSLDDFLFVLDRDFKLISYNEVVERRLGYNADELSRMDAMDMHPQPHRDSVRGFLEKAMAGKANLCPVPLMTKAGVSVPVETVITLGQWNDQFSIFCFSRDISQRLEMEKARRKSEEILRTAVEAMDQGFVIYDGDNRMVMCNSKIKEIYPLLADKFVPGTLFEDMLAEAIAKRQVQYFEGGAEELYNERLAAFESGEGRNIQYTSEGRWIKASDRATPDGGTVGYRVDITDIKESEKKLKAALKEKETLLKEIHHRVKNNMQVVNSLLSLQAKREASPLVQEAFAEARGRVQSMALVHEILYQSENLADIDLQTYLEHLTRQLRNAFASGLQRVEVTVEAEGIRFGIDEAVPFGLIVTELVSNAFKYAFSDGRGSLYVGLSELPSGMFRLVVNDDGIGLPEDFDFRLGNTLGLWLISELVEGQLEGTWRLVPGDGAKWEIEWPMMQ